MSSENFIKNITSKDLNLSLNTIKTLINSGDLKLFKELCQKADFIFPFLKKRITDDFVKLINKENLNIIFEFSKIYCEDFEDIIVKSWLKFACEDLTDEILELFESGTCEQKTYCASYFKHIQDPLALEYLYKESSSDYFYLKNNCAQALSNFNDETILNDNFEKITTSKDEFEKLSAYEFIVAYNSKKSIQFALDNCFKSPFVLNIICLILNNNNFEILKNILEEEKIAQIFHILLENYPENLTLDTISYYQIIDFIKYLKNSDEAYSKNLLLCAKEQFNEYYSNNIYTYDLDKNTKNELKEIIDILNEIDFQNLNLENELDIKYFNNPRFELAIDIIKNKKITKYSDILINLINQKNLPQKTLIKILETIKEIGELSKIDKTSIETIEDENAKAFCLSLF